MGLLDKPTMFSPEGPLATMAEGLSAAKLSISCIEILFQQKNDAQINKLSKLFKDLEIVYGRKFEEKLTAKYRKEGIDYDVDDIIAKENAFRKKKFLELIPKTAPKWLAELKKQKVNVGILYDILDEAGFTRDSNIIINMYRAYHTNPTFATIFNSYGGNAPIASLSSTKRVQAKSSISTNFSAPSNSKLNTTQLKTVNFLQSSFEDTGFEMAWLNLLFDAKLSVEVTKLKNLIAAAQECFEEWLEEDNDDFVGANGAAQRYFVENLPKKCPKWMNLLKGEKVTKNDFKNLWTGFVEADIISNPEFISKWYKTTI